VVGAAMVMGLWHWRPEAASGWIAVVGDGGYGGGGRRWVGDEVGGGDDRRWWLPEVVVVEIEATMADGVCV
jgi:hypothetical protein